MTYKQAIVKSLIERMLMYPFVLSGKIYAYFFPLKTKHGVVIFCPSADIGGSVRVTIDLCLCFAHKSPLVIFSKRPKNNKFLHLFNIEGIRMIDLHRYIDYKFYHFINFFYRGVITSWLNNVQASVVIGSESLFFYKVLPHIKKEIRRVDICHLNSWFNYTQAFIKYLDARIFSTEKLKRDAQTLYNLNKLPPHFHSRLYFIDNKIDLPKYVLNNNDILSVVFIGRGALQKRIHIVSNIAKKIEQMKANIHFSFVGDVDKMINPSDLPFCTFYGNIKDRYNLEQIYQQSDVLLLTSSYEGLPLVVMEMMAYGKVIVSTAVDAIPDYITDGENGFLIENNTDENKIIDDAISVLLKLASNKLLLQQMGAKSRIFAEKHFNEDTFCQNYQKILFD